MNLPDPAELGGELLGGPAGALGNLVLVVPGAAPDAKRLLKVYRARGSRWKEFWRDLWVRHGEGKLGVSPAERCRTERRALALWAAEGFDVPRLLEGEPPPWAAAHPHLWLEWLPGRTLHLALAEGSIAGAAAVAVVERLAAEHGRRHARALALDEPLLLQEHPTTKHVMVSGERLVTFDLEYGYPAGYSLLQAIGQELAGVLRSLWTARPGEFPALLAAFVRGYGDRELLRRAATLLVDSAAPSLVLKRLQDRRRRRRAGKTAALVELLALLAPDAPRPELVR